MRVYIWYRQMQKITLKTDLLNMYSNISNILKGKSLRFFLCLIALTTATSSFAQVEMDDEEIISVKQPKRTQAADKNPTIVVNGVVLDHATKKPLAGGRLQTLNDKRYAAMTNADGQFSIKVPTFATSLYVEVPNYLAQQVAIRSNDAGQKVKIEMLSGAFDTMYGNGTEYTAKASFTSDNRGVSIDEEISRRIGADIRTTMHSGNLEQGAAMFIRGINSINANAQPLVILDGVELDMQRARTSLHQGDIFNMLSSVSPEDIDKVEAAMKFVRMFPDKQAIITSLDKAVEALNGETGTVITFN